MNHSALILRHLANDQSMFHTCNAPKSDLLNAADYIDMLEAQTGDQFMIIRQLQEKISSLESNLKSRGS